MTFLRSLLVWAITANALQLSTGSSDYDGDGTDECGLYLAESTIKKNGGWGVFAGKHFDKGELIGAPGIGIPITDPDKVFADEGALSEFLWESGRVGGGQEAEHVDTALPGIGMMVNYHQLTNVGPGGLTEEKLFDRQADPEAGSSTEHNNFGFVATQIIQPGQELLTAGKPSDWFKEAGLPLAADYNRAQLIVNYLHDFKKAHPEITEAQDLDILYRMKNEIIQSNDGAANLLPLTSEELDLAFKNGVAELEFEAKDFSWVKENGMCLDHIRQGKSNIPGAGRGAFATRFIPKGSLISPAPLVQVMDKESFRIDGDMNATQQLMLNYCFGHRKSDVLLCPTTYVTLINHKSSGSNAAIRWSSWRAPNKNSEGQPHMLSSLDDLKTDSTKASFNSRLMFEYVASEDINEGDEIFLDYGDEWETAWKDHMSSWRKPPGEKNYIPAVVMNKEQRPVVLSNDPTMEHLSYQCRFQPYDDEGRVKGRRKFHQEDYRALKDADPEFWMDPVLEVFSDTNKQFNWWPCDVVAAEPDGLTFEIIAYTKYLEKKQKFRLMKNVPRNAIRFVDKPYHSDQHLQTSFRHYIPIPDSHFPLRWRTDYTTANSIGLGVHSKGLDFHEDGNSHLAAEFEKTLREVKCGMYFAPSNIEGAGFGIYTTVELPGSGICMGTDLPAVPVFQLMPRSDNWAGSDYVWSGHGFGHSEFEASNDSPEQAAFLAVNNGALANAHPGLVKLQIKYPIYNPVADRRKDPGAGAFSDYIEFTFESSLEVGAGEELFVNYGESWFTDREQFRGVPMSADYAEANRIIASLWSLSTMEGADVKPSAIEDLLQTVIKGNNFIETYRAQMALQGVDSWNDLQHLIARNGTAEFGTEARSMEWFEENGQCMDHLYVKRSTIEQAGQGAFTRRPLKKGDIVISSPLIATWGRDQFFMNNTFLPDDVQKTQLIMNYQYAHLDSSALFFPITTALAINHNSDRRSSGKAANAKLQWSTWNKKSAYFLRRPLEELKKERYSTMVLDFVATRDIHPDEELFIDYGEEWESAWEKHVKEFPSKAPCRKSSKRCFESSKVIDDMNSDKFNPLFHQWSNEHLTVCDPKSRPARSQNDILLRGPDDSGFVENVVDEYMGITWHHVGFNYTKLGAKLVPCQIIVSRKKEALFDVVYFARDHALVSAQAVPANSVKFVSKPYKSDMFWSGAFRHEIKIPDEIFPTHWKDLLPREGT